MKPISYARHRFPPDVILDAIWLYLRFTLSYRDVEDLLAERGLIVSNEAIRRRVLKFGPEIARNLRAIRPKAYTRWHLDEMVVSLSGKQICTCGRHPTELTPTRLFRLSKDLPHDWQEQWHFLGLAA